MSSSIQDKLSRWLSIQLLEEQLMNPSSSYFTIEDSFTDMTTQTAPTPDSPITVKFGSAKTTPSGLLSMDAAGVLTVLKEGPYFAKTRVNCGRTGSSGTSILHLWVEISVDGGATWLVSGNIVDIRLDNASDTDTFFDMTPVYLPAGAKARTRFVRSSLGNNSGDITSSTLSTALQTYGLTPAPSAQLSMYKSNDWVY